MIILDTNVLSALMRQAPEARVVDWLDRQPRTSVWTTSVTILEVRFGLQILATGRRRTLLTEAFEKLLARMGQRVATFDTAAAGQASELMAARHRKGRPVDLRDTMIAGIAIAQHATLATRNTVHFEDAPIPLVDPWTR
ncbi:MAG TPA: type II toxin-antitoxin system VapC family toxin [Terriglobales bacterium]|nr:type II toxin-antitoxin system VapC family toxin [Terriglobales bacterium]